MTIEIPLLFVVIMLNRSTQGEHLILQRILIIIGLILISLFFARWIHPRSELIKAVTESRKKNLINRTRWIWYPFAVGFPLWVALIAWLGYSFAAFQLTSRYLLTVLLIALLFLVWSLAIRWNDIALRWFRIRVLRQKRLRPKEETHTLEGQVQQLHDREEEQKQDHWASQILRMINVLTIAPGLIALWMIWIDVLPAVNYLENVEFWHVKVETEIISPEGTADFETRYEPVTLIDFFYAAFTLAVTIIIARNLPALLDIMILTRLGLESSLIYAITTVVSYLVLIGGVVLSFSYLEFQWEQVQWLAAALTFGLSFGLQEIFANFISGLIILFERPIRIGDIVTIDGVTGVVSRVRIRASTITDWDKKEYLVPNKDIVTGRVLNWTLSDTMNRFVVAVGVAYGCDTDRVREILFEIAKDDPEILNDPSTLVTFEGFGDNSLNFIMRAYLATMDHRLETIHRIHTIIHKRFLDEGIEISFPQRDLHIRSLPPEWQSAKPDLNQNKASDQSNN